MPAQIKVQIPIRAPKDLSDKLKKKALEMGVSMNAYILMVLTKELSRDEQK